MVIDSTTHPRIEKYVKGVMNRFKHDDRIFIWDLYNEPTNGGLGTASLPLLQKVIHWAREVAPAQPITIGVWNGNQRLNEIALAGSDIISFHNYGNKENLVKHIAELKQHNRPLLNTEWMNRPAGSIIEDNLPVFYTENVGCMLWGLVNGKTQTHLPWGHRPGDPPPNVWQHDLYKSDFTPYSVKELKLIREFVEKSKSKSKHTKGVSVILD